jgi:hypothetical protein
VPLKCSASNRAKLLSEDADQLSEISTTPQGTIYPGASVQARPTQGRLAQSLQDIDCRLIE